MADPERWNMQEMLDLAGRAIGKVDRRGLRGIHMVTCEEIAAMAALLALGGVPAIEPAPLQDRSPFSPIKGQAK